MYLLFSSRLALAAAALKLDQKRIADLPRSSSVDLNVRKSSLTVTYCNCSISTTSRKQNWRRWPGRRARFLRFASPIWNSKTNRKHGWKSWKAKFFRWSWKCFGKAIVRILIQLQNPHKNSRANRALAKATSMLRDTERELSQLKSVARGSNQSRGGKRGGATRGGGASRGGAGATRGRGGARGGGRGGKTSRL